MKKIEIPGVKLLNNYFITEEGQVWSERTNKFLKTSKLKKGYLRYSLQTSEGSKKFMAHRLVLMMFDPVENMDELQVNHKDGDKENNKLPNLEWCNNSENGLHAVQTGLRVARKGDECSFATLNEESVKIIIEEILKGEKSLAQIGRDFGVTRYTIHDIKRKKSWKHLTTNIEFK